MVRPNRILFALTVIAVGIGGAFLLRLRQLHVREARAVQTRAMLHVLSTRVAMSGAGLPRNSTDQILSALALQQHELEALIDRKLTVEEGSILDSWGNPIRLTFLDGDTALMSFGPNGKDDSGTEDDIVKHLDMKPAP